MGNQFFAFSVALFAVTGTAHAEGTGPYVEIGAGTGWANQIRYDVATTPNPTAAGIIIKHKTGKDLSITLGQDFGFFRVEAEVAQRDATPSQIVTTVSVPVKQLAGATVPVTSKGTFTAPVGQSIARSAMINVYAQTGNPDVTRFYVGGGVGYGRSYAHGYAASTAATAEILRGHDGGKVWQLLAGAREPIGEHMTIGIRYRYYHPGKMRLTDPLDREVTGRLIVHSIQATLGYRF